MAASDSAPAPPAAQQLAVVVIVVGVMVLGAICGVLKMQVNGLHADARAQQADTKSIRETADWLKQYANSAAAADANRKDPNWLQGMLDSTAKSVLRVAPQAIRPGSENGRFEDLRFTELTFNVSFNSLTRQQIAEYTDAVQKVTPLRLRDVALTARVNQPSDARGAKGEAYRVDKLVFSCRLTQATTE
jgi:hypothetical protein